MYKQDSRFTFGPSFSAPGGFPFTEDDIRHEPLFFASDIDFAYDRGGPITQAFLQALPEEWIDDEVILDTRAHMLQVGYYPCIPGWHHDDVQRGEDGQPDYDNPGEAIHVMATVNGPICPTVFLKPGLVEFPKTPKGQIVYGHLHPIIAALAEQRGTIEAPDATLIFFDAATWHTGQAAKAPGWRWFARASRRSARRFHNDIRTQVNVYVPEHLWTAGW